MPCTLSKFPYMSSDNLLHDSRNIRIPINCIHESCPCFGFSRACSERPVATDTLSGVAVITMPYYVGLEPYFTVGTPYFATTVFTLFYTKTKTTFAALHYVIILR